MSTRYYLCFREMDGDWSPWQRCSREDYERNNGVSDARVRRVFDKEDRTPLTTDIICGIKEPKS